MHYPVSILPPSLLVFLFSPSSHPFCPSQKWNSTLWHSNRTASHLQEEYNTPNLFNLHYKTDTCKHQSNGHGLAYWGINSCPLLFCSVIGTPPQSDWPTNVSLPQSSFSRYVPFSLAELIPEMCRSGVQLLKVGPNSWFQMLTSFRSGSDTLLHMGWTYLFTKSELILNGWSG